MFYAVACNEDAPLISASQAKQDNTNIFGNNEQTFIQVCAAWPHGRSSGRCA